MGKEDERNWLEEEQGAEVSEERSGAWEKVGSGASGATRGASGGSSGGLAGPGPGPGRGPAAGTEAGWEWLEPEVRPPAAAAP